MPIRNMHPKHEIAFAERSSTAAPAAAGGAKERKDVLRAAVNASSDAIFVVDLETLRFVDANDAAVRLLGYSLADLLARGPADVSIHPRSELEAAYRALLADGGGAIAVETELIRSTGTRVPVRLSRHPLVLNGKPYVVGAARDLSEARRAEREIAQGRELYRTLFDLNPLPMWVYDLDSLAFLEVNRAAVRQYGYTSEEFLAMTIRDIRPEDEQQRLAENLAQASADYEYAGIWRHRVKDGRVIEVDITSHVVDFGGRRAKLVLANDVTAKLAAERSLRASDERFELVARATNDIVWDWNLTNDERWWNPNMQSLLGYDPASLASGGAYWGVHPDDRERVIAGVRAAIASNTNVWSDEYRLRHRDGHYLDIYDRGFVLRNDRGEPVRMIGAMMDITERKRAAEALTHHLTHDITTGLPR